MADAPEAREIVLRKFRPLAPPFHRHIVKSKLRGKICQAGQRVVVYDIVATVPDGEVRVTETTVFRFE